MSTPTTDPTSAPATGAPTVTSASSSSTEAAGAMPRGEANTQSGPRPGSETDQRVSLAMAGFFTDTSEISCRLNIS